MEGGPEMPKVDVYNMKGEVVGEVNLNDDIFGVKVNEVAMHTVVVNQLANARQGTQSTKTISEVRGGGKAMETKRNRKSSSWKYPFGTMGGRRSSICSKTT